MSRCLAYNQKDRPCCNYGRVLSRTDEVVTYAPTCHIHKDYFESEKNVEEWKWLVEQTLYSYDRYYKLFICKDNIFHILLAALQAGVVSLKKTEDLVDTILTREKRADFSGYVSKRILPYLM